MRATLRQIFERGTIRTYDKDDIIIFEGDYVNDLYFIESGYVKVYNFMNNGSERIIFVYSPGDVFPLTTHLTRREAAGYFYAGMTEVQVRTIKPAQLDEQLNNNIEKGEKLIEYINEVNQEFFQRIDILSVNDTRRKIIALFAFLAQKTGTEDGKGLIEIDLPITHQDIGNMSGLTRESTSRQIASLREEGLIVGTKKLSVNSHKLEAAKEDMTITT